MTMNEVKPSSPVKSNKIKSNIINDILPTEPSKLKKKLVGGVPLIGLVPNHKLKQTEQSEQEKVYQNSRDCEEMYPETDNNSARSLELLLLGIEPENSPVKSHKSTSILSPQSSQSLQSQSQSRKKCQVRRPVSVVLNDIESDEESVEKRSDRKKRDISSVKDSISPLQQNERNEQIDQNEQKVKRKKTLTFQDVGNVEKKGKKQSTNSKRKGTPYKSNGIGRVFDNGYDDNVETNENEQENDDYEHSI